MRPPSSRLRGRASRRPEVGTRWSVQPVSLPHLDRPGRTEGWRLGSAQPVWRRGEQARRGRPGLDGAIRPFGSKADLTHGHIMWDQLAAQILLMASLDGFEVFVGDGLVRPRGRQGSRSRRVNQRFQHRSASASRSSAARRRSREAPDGRCRWPCRSSPVGSAERKCTARARVNRRRALGASRAAGCSRRTPRADGWSRSGRRSAWSSRAGVARMSCTSERSAPRFSSRPARS